MDTKLTTYDAFSHAPDPLKGNEPRDIYRDVPEAKIGKFSFSSPFYGKIRQKDGSLRETNRFDIAYTLQGNEGPLIISLHGVPTNRKRHYPLLRRLKKHTKFVCIDMLGMGESSHPLEYGFKIDEDLFEEYGLSKINKPWDWINDTVYIHEFFHGFLRSVFPDDDKFIFIADDWGGGINSHYAAKYPNDLAAFIQIDPIAGQGYPVAEIQAIGRASQIGNSVMKRLENVDIKDDTKKALAELFTMNAIGSIDQTMVQIFKTMVHNPSDVYNQWSLRTLKETYVDTDYERSQYRDGEDADSLTLRLRPDAITVLADRAAILAPALLLPYDPIKNPKGVQFDKITAPSLILWSEQDSMMPAPQIYDFMYQLKNSQSVRVALINNSGHFAIDDQPDRVAEEILNFLVGTYGATYLADIFFGFSGIWKGDEEMKIRDLRRLYGFTN